jgi:hypothetical protein
LSFIADMRTSPVRILAYGGRMINSQLNETLARQRQQDVLDAAARVRLARHVKARRPRRLRTRAGWWLVQMGINMVLRESAEQSVSARPPVTDPVLEPLA